MSSFFGTATPHEQVHACLLQTFPLAACSKLEQLMHDVVVPNSQTAEVPAYTSRVLEALSAQNTFEELMRHVFGSGPNTMIGDSRQARSWFYLSNYSPHAAKELVKLLQPKSPFFQLMCMQSVPDAACRFEFPISRLPERARVAWVDGSDAVAKESPLFRLPCWKRKDLSSCYLNMFAYYAFCFAEYLTCARSTALREAAHQSQLGLDLNELARSLGAPLRDLQRGDLGLLPHCRDTLAVAKGCWRHGMEEARKAVQCGKAILKRQRRVHKQAEFVLAEDSAYYELLDLYLEYLYKDYPADAQPMTYHWAAGRGNQTQLYFASIFVMALREYWLDSDVQSRGPPPSPTSHFSSRHFSVVRGVARLARHERAHLCSYRRPAPSPGTVAPVVAGSQRFFPLEELSRELYSGFLHYLLNAMARCDTSSPAPIELVTEVWREYAFPFDSCPDIKPDHWPWTAFILQHYEIYSLPFFEYLRLASKSGMLFQRPNGPPAFHALIAAFLRHPFLQLLKEISRELQEYQARKENPAAGTGSWASLRYIGELNRNFTLRPQPVRGSSHVPIFCSETSEAASCLVIDAQTRSDDASQYRIIEIAELLQQIFDWKELPYAKSAVTGEYATAPSVNYRDVTMWRKKYQVDPDRKPITPAENAWLVIHLLEFQQTVEKAVRNTFGVQLHLRLRLLAAYPVWVILFAVFAVMFLLGFSASARAFAVVAIFALLRATAA
eukprot:TRINITY_DN27642_c0_g1_i2.p1 TRINITY_DN27642_c0_g1~~TRINITY_DN27642_c0_g1_i2.p1  ORF type:complete len:724 (+),score=70.07 TRINITY_DN27642_c0_g1_i2:28-2199(+)